MLTLNSSPHIRTSKNIKSFHSCQTSTGWSMSHVDIQRAYREEIALGNRTLHRSWLVQQWNEHLERCWLRKTE
jgi:hypothetical protein